jgi:hypothetical protein
MLFTDGIFRVESRFDGGAPGRWLAVVVKRLDGAKSTTVTASATPSAPSSSAVAIGAGIGGTLFALLIVAAVAFLVWRARKSRPQQHEPKPSATLNYAKIPQISSDYVEIAVPAPAPAYSNIPSVENAYTNVPNMAGREPAVYTIGNL